jgi:ribosome recycling factor
MKGQADVYKETRVFTYPGMVVRVHIPDLTEEERARRMKILHDAAAEIIKAALKVKHQEE